MALGEFGYPYLINPDDLSTKGVFDYNGKLPGNMTAHPRIDPVTGELLFFGYDVREPYMTYMRADANGKMLQVEPITMSGPSMVHDFAVTDEYVVFMEMQVVFSWFSAVSGSGLPFKWDDNAPCRFGVMPPKLRFEHAVYMTGLLFLSEMDSPLRHPSPSSRIGGFARDGTSAFDRTFLRVAPLSLEK